MHTAKANSITIEPLPLTGGAEAVYYFHSDHLGSASWITNGTGAAVQHLQYLPFGEHFVNEQSSGYFERFTFTGKERDLETGYYYHGARFNSSDIGWLSVNPMSDKYPSISPYAYCAWNPIKLVDPDGKKDRPFKIGDKYVSDIPGSETPIISYTYSKYLPITFFSAYSILMTYNCHSFAWHDSWGDKNPAQGDILYSDDNLKFSYLPRWDKNPADDIKDVLERGGRQLDANENNIINDRVIYYTDQNKNGMYDDGEYISHSAIVYAIDNEGYTTEVIGKRGAAGISINHPNAPGYYTVANDPNTGQKEIQSRAYFRMPQDN